MQNRGSGWFYYWELERAVGDFPGEVDEVRSLPTAARRPSYLATQISTHTLPAQA
jgi:hypothetical protein